MNSMRAHCLARPDSSEAGFMAGQDLLLLLRSSHAVRLVPTVFGYFLAATALRAQTCFEYVDNTWSGAPLECVQKDDFSDPCSWPTDCTTIPSATPQTVLFMHELWHDCFGSTGGGSPPTGRGQRWYAFHRQFEVDFNIWRDDFGIPHIESLEWCPGMDLPIGHFGAAEDGYAVPETSLSADLGDCNDDGYCKHVRTGCDPGGGSEEDRCGWGVPRPYGRDCDDCEAFPACLFFEGAGPVGCAAGPSDVYCDGVERLEDFATADDVANVLDAYFHGAMHGAVGFADGGGYSQDLYCSNCSPRDPMFWRLHKALDDVVRAWQDHKSVDVMLVIDRSGSMSELDTDGVTTKLEAALEAATLFAAMMEAGRSDGLANRVGVVSYAGGATLHMPLTTVDGSLLGDGVEPHCGAGDVSDFCDALDDIRALGANGCTGIGGGIENAVEELCPPGDCQGFSAAGDNDRKAILVLTDGVENRPPCLESIDPVDAGTCGSTCSGEQFDIDRMEYTELTAVGFGNSVNQELLTLLAERQGGIFVQNPADSLSWETDLKKFFVMAFGQLTDEFLLEDPGGFLPAGAPVTPPVFHNSCDNTKLTFASGWRPPAVREALRLIVTAPNGDLVWSGDPKVQSLHDTTWDYARIRLPYHGASQGSWRAHLIRPHEAFVNGFAPDAFVDVKQGVELVRRQIQRLCPDGCKQVLYFEHGRKGPASAYELALKAELETGLVGNVKQAADPAEFAALLPGPWDLVVYAYMGPIQPMPYDSLLTNALCQHRRAIITETRVSPNIPIFECLGVRPTTVVNWDLMTGDGRLLDGSVKFVNPGHTIWTYGLRRLVGDDYQATANDGKTGAIYAETAPGPGHHWFINVLGSGLSKLDIHLQHSTWRTDRGLTASVRMLPSYVRAGGYDKVDARVEVEHPLVGLGTLLTQVGLRDEMIINGERVSRRAATLMNLGIPKQVTTFPMYDDGTHGDIHPGNATWTAELTNIPVVDGTYRLRFILDLTAGGCTTRREFTQSLFVDLAADPGASSVDVGQSTQGPGGTLITPVRILPRDLLGNLWGPGRAEGVTCGPPDQCRIFPDRGVTDDGQGLYTVLLNTPQQVATVQLHAFGGTFNIPIPCPNCPVLADLNLDRGLVTEHTVLKGQVRLSGPAPGAGTGGALVYLQSDQPLVAAVPEFVEVLPGQILAGFPITVTHLEDPSQKSLDVVITATYGKTTMSAPLKVIADAHPGDFDGDGDVDTADYAIFLACATGPEIPYDPARPPPNCTAEPDLQGFLPPDSDRDRDIDQSDYGVWQHRFGRHARPSDHH